MENKKISDIEQQKKRYACFECKNLKEALIYTAVDKRPNIVCNVLDNKLGLDYCSMKNKDVPKTDPKEHTNNDNRQILKFVTLLFLGCLLILTWARFLKVNGLFSMIRYGFILTFLTMLLLLLRMGD